MSTEELRCSVAGLEQEKLGILGRLDLLRRGAVRPVGKGEREGVVGEWVVYVAPLPHHICAILELSWWLVLCVWVFTLDGALRRASLLLVSKDDRKSELTCGICVSGLGGGRKLM